MGETRGVLAPPAGQQGQQVLEPVLGWARQPSSDLDSDSGSLSLSRAMVWASSLSGGVLGA